MEFRLRGAERTSGGTSVRPQEVIVGERVLQIVKSKYLPACSKVVKSAVKITKSWPLLANWLYPEHRAGKLPASAAAVRKYRGLRAGRRPRRLNEPPTGKPAQFLPFDISFADSCRTNSGILSHWLSERHRSISVSSREPDFLAVILVSGLGRTKTPQEDPSRCCGGQANAYNAHSFRSLLSK